MSHSRTREKRGKYKKESWSVDVAGKKVLIYSIEGNTQKVFSPCVKFRFINHETLSEIF